MIAVLYPRFDHPAIEERYASWQSQLLLRREPGTEVEFYDPEESASAAAGLTDAEFALVITDPLLLPPPNIASRLRELLLHSPGVVAALPVSNEATHPSQRRSPTAMYVTLRELEQVMTMMQKGGATPARVTWDASDPAVYLCRTEFLDGVTASPRDALAGQPVVISQADYAHRWIVMRSEFRADLLPFIPEDAHSVLELGCGDASLGVAIKQRQKARVVGVEIDKQACAIARKRIDDVYCGDVREIAAILEEKFDCIVGSEIVEHVDDPWSLLAELRRIAKPGGRLILSIPNIAHASIVADLLQGRFDYAYIGLACAGHLRFFTRRSIQEMLQIAGWTAVEMTPQLVPSLGGNEVIERIAAAGIPLSKEDLRATGYYVVAQNSR